MRNAALVGAALAVDDESKSTVAPAQDTSAQACRGAT